AATAAGAGGPARPPRVTPAAGPGPRPARTRQLVHLQFPSGYNGGRVRTQSWYHPVESTAALREPSSRVGPAAVACRGATRSCLMSHPRFLTLAVPAAAAAALLFACGAQAAGHGGGGHGGGGHGGGGHAGGAHVGGAHVGGAHVGGAHVGGAHVGA